MSRVGTVEHERYSGPAGCRFRRRAWQWVETVASGWNCLAGTDPAKIESAARGQESIRRKERPELCGNGHTAENILAAFNNA